MNWSDISYCSIDFLINRSKLKLVVLDLRSATKTLKNHSVDKTFQLIRIIDFNRADPTCYRTNFC